MSGPAPELEERRTGNGRPAEATEDMSTLAVERVVEHFDTDPGRGLDSATASQRLARWGPNEIRPAPTIARWRRFIAHFADPVVYLLIAATVISTVVWLWEGADGIPLDATVIMLIVVINAVVGYLQESKAEAAVAALRVLTRSEATVLRDGALERIAAAELVPGDMVSLATGDMVPADVRLIDVEGLQIAEAVITGESAPVDKATAPVEPGTTLGDRSSMAFSGTAVVRGRAAAVVTATGDNTEMGRIATLLQETEQEETPLQRDIDRVGRLLGVAVVAVAVIVVLTLIVVDGLRTGPELIGGLLIGLSLAVAAVPEGLPAVLSVVLALGVQRMSQRNALVKRLVSVEALGSASIICTDKTGTLTRNEMLVRRLVVPSGEVGFSGEGYGPAGQVLFDGGELVDPIVRDEVRWALTAAGLASDASITAEGDRHRAVGDPTEAALLAAGAKAGIDHDSVGVRLVRAAELSFTAERRRMSTLHIDPEDPRHLHLVVKGAPDALIERCDRERRAGVEVPLSTGRRGHWNGVVDGLAGQGLRTLAIAHRRIDRSDSDSDSELALDANAGIDEAIEVDLTLLGIVGILDPPRPEARRAIAVAHRAGIRVAMITGDHPATAAQIAIELGIAGPDDPTITGAELSTMGDRELAEVVQTATVYARVAPEHKLRIVRALADQGEVVAMTGDGVNDAPALKAAGIGIAMGLTGSDVSKEAADMILTDDNFATIVTAVNEGRGIFHNIRSFLRYLLSSNVGEVLTVFLGVIGAGIIGLSASAGDGLAAPLLAVHILWINLVTDAAPALALGVDPPMPGLMERRPRNLDDRVIDGRMQRGIGLIGLTMALATLAMLDLKLPGGLVEGNGDLVEARTAAFTVLVLAQLFNTFNARSDTASAFVGLLANRWLLAAIALSLGLQVAVVQLPILNRAFTTVPLSPGEWLIAALLAGTVLWVGELRKLVLRLGMVRKPGGDPGSPSDPMGSFDPSSGADAG